ncbi:aminotransferase class I/II-fold pyridoxal phosphate-dependent enzyme [Aromatoleum toluvorans]|uniref:Aminotransferase class I/II-fold pyridoxal phosphate-dependent enzyme n=1 Tax=Aromatoleum toluvorans TaxID=92002 RepID=A0ABX1PYA2_9RHOO|nr:PLP-dependent aminotransferase family protein [Aromatoleum toluvorans]NMG44434.1 aminotransferase class I/II-fold pyridoxal phosphate-dependent enzyme [Aromatoleum toluvorans]
MNLYDRLTLDIEQRIREGVLRSGERLPSVRQACQAQRLSPATVLKAYYQLESRGLVEARPKSGFFVRARPRRAAEPQTNRPASPSRALQVSDFIFQILESVKDPAVVPLGSNFASPELYPLDKLGRFLAAAARRMDPRATVTDLPPGNDELRRQIALRYLAGGATVAPAEIVITCGAMEALNLCVEAVTRPGDLVAVESPTFPPALQMIERHGLKVIEIPSHPEEGVDLAALADALRHHPIKACLFMLNFQHPTGSLVPDDARRALLDLLRQHDVPLIEDDTYAELHFDRHAPLATKALDPTGLVMHVSSFSKSLAPGYRVGWVAAGRHAQKIQRLKVLTSLATTIPVQIALAEFLKQGAFDAHLRRLRSTLETREAAMAAAIRRHFPPGTRLTRPRGGYFTWVELPPDHDALALHRRALEEGISIAPGPMFSAAREYRNCIRLNFGHAWSEELERALALLGAMSRDAVGDAGADGRSAHAGACV